MNLVPLSEVCKIVNGGTPKSGVAEYWGGDVAWLTPAEMGKLDTPEIAETARNITVAGLKGSSAKQVPVGSVIMSTRAPIGHLAIPLMPMAFNQGCRGLVPSNRLDTKYLYYFLWFSREALNDLGTGTTFKELSTGALGGYKIPLPPLEGQRRIVAMLDEAFAAIATATANARKNLANARELFSSVVASAFGPSAEGLQRISFGAFCQFQRGFDLPTKERRPGSVPLVSSSGVIDAVDTAMVAGPGVITGRSGSIGKVFFEMEDFWPLNTTLYVKNFFGNTPRFVYHFLRAFDLGRFATGAGVPTLNRNFLNDITIGVPHTAVQQNLADAFDELESEVESVSRTYKTRIAELECLKQSILHRAFAGELTEASTTVSVPSNDNFATPEFTANVIAYAYWLHKKQKRDKSFKRIKAQKCLHNVEAIAGVDLGRQPRQYRNGPHDEPHMARAQEWAKSAGFFEFVLGRDGKGYDFKKLPNYNEHWIAAVAAINPVSTLLERAIGPLVPMNMEEAEVFTTVHAAWNNLIRDGVTITDNAIVKAARDDWDPPKNIPERKFREAIKLIRSKAMTPDGSAKYVGGQASLF